MKKVSNNVSEQLENAAQEALQQLDPFHQLMNAGVEYEQEQEEEKPKRKRRTKAEIAEDNAKARNAEVAVLKCNGTSHITATVEWDQDKDDTTKIPTLVEIPDSILVNDYNIDTISDYLSNASGYCHKGFTLSWPEHHDTHDEFCDWEIEKAHLYGKSNPDFDYRLFYQKGDKIYLVRYYDKNNTKDIIYMTLRTIYARNMVGVVEKQYCQCVGISDKDFIFIDKQDAMDYFDSIDANVEESEDQEDTGKKKHKRKKQDEQEEIDNEIDTEETEEEE